MLQSLRNKININKGTVRSVGVYIFTSFFSKGIAFLLIPLFTNPAYLTPEDNGILSIFSSALMLLTPFLTLGMVQSASADFFKNEKKDFATANTSNIIIGFILMLAGMLLLFLIKGYLKTQFSFPESFVFILPFIVFQIFFSEQLLVLIRNRNEVNVYAASNMSKALIEYGIAVLLIVVFFQAWQGRVWGIAASLVAINLFGVWYYTKHKYWSFNFKLSYFFEEIKFGIPIIAFQMAVFLLGATNKLFLAVFDVDKAQLGIYAIASIMGTLIGTVGSSILMYMQPRLYSILSNGNANPKVVKKEFIRYLLMLLICSVACVGAVIFLYYFFINKLYLSGIPWFLLVCISSFIWMINSFFFLFLLYQKAKKKIFTLSIASIVCSTAVNIVMVKNFLILGDALAGIINTIIFSLLLYFICGKTIAQAFKQKPIDSFESVIANEPKDII